MPPTNAPAASNARYEPIPPTMTTILSQTGTRDRPTTK